MWPRVIEVMLGCWLAISPFIFRHPTGDWRLWANDLACALAVVVLALLSCWRPLRRAHLATAAVALWLMGFGYFISPHPLPAGLQNDLLTGLLLLMLAIIPTEANLPPQRWREFTEDKCHSSPGGTS